MGAEILICRAEGFRAFQVWRRLFRTSLPNVPLQSAICADRKTATQILAGLPPSEGAEVEVREPAADLFEGHPLAVVVYPPTWESHKFLGGPSDEVWDRIEELLKTD